MFLFIAILLVTGLAFDFMRNEHLRVQVQATADRASLAAATLREGNDREAVVRQYFERAGLTEHLQNVEVVSALNSSQVRVTATARTATLFLPWVGVDRLGGTIVSAAREEIPNIEISLVLDISGSMRWQDSGGMPRIERLRGAAQEFISIVLNPTNPYATSMSIVPYAGTVNPGEEVYGLLGGTPWHGYSHCPDLPRSVFASTGLPDADSMPQAPHFMYWAVDWPTMDWGWCPKESNSILYHSSDEAQLHQFIQDLRLHDGTGTHYAMRWGLALLDPDSNWLTQQLAASNRVDAQLADRPADWDDDETIKIVVLMTDGNITDQFRPRRPGSSIFGTNGVYPTEDEQDVLNMTHIQALGSDHRQRITTQNQNSADFYSACELAKENGAIIYTIAFETGTRGQQEMSACATSQNHYFNARGIDLDTAFRAIANSMLSLRLVQ